MGIRPPGYPVREEELGHSRDEEDPVLGALRGPLFQPASDVEGWVSPDVERNKTG